MGRKAVGRSFSNITSNRSSVLQVAVGAIIAAVGVNVIGNSLSFTLDFGWDFVVGTLLVLAALACLAWPRMKPATFDRRIRGFVLYDKRSNELLHVPGYALTDEAAELLQVSLAEDGAIRGLWHGSPMSEMSSTPAYPFRPASSSINLLNDLLEYLVLQRLAADLSTHFGDEPGHEARLSDYRLEDAPQALFQNRFLELFSRRPEDRATSPDLLNQKASVPGGETGEGAHSSTSTLRLPVDSSLGKPTDGGINVSSPQVSVRIRTNFSGATVDLPSSFIEHYVGVRPGSADVQSYSAELQISVEVHEPMLFSRSAQVYAEWVETFMETLERQYSADAFFARIGWPQLEAALRILGGPKPK
jgi:hypothetical protein